jgi:hypothetical protein
VQIGNKRSGGRVDGSSPWVRWRAERLVSAGFDGELAARLAGQERVDLHAVLELLDRGCPAHLAARILWPLDEPREQA